MAYRCPQGDLRDLVRGSLKAYLIEFYSVDDDHASLIGEPTTRFPTGGRFDRSCWYRLDSELD